MAALGLNPGTSTERTSPAVLWWAKLPGEPPGNALAYAGQRCEVADSKVSMGHLESE